MGVLCLYAVYMCLNVHLHGPHGHALVCSLREYMYTLCLCVHVSAHICMCGYVYM